MTKRVRGCAKQSVETLEKVFIDCCSIKEAWEFYLKLDAKDIDIDRVFFLTLTQTDIEILIWVGVKVISVMPDLEEVSNILNRCTL